VFTKSARTVSFAVIYSKNVVEHTVVMISLELEWLLAERRNAFDFKMAQHGSALRAGNEFINQKRDFYHC
jgi:hypothetical protein